MRKIAHASAASLIAAAVGLSSGIAFGHDFGVAGVLSRDNQAELEPIKLSSSGMEAPAEYRLKSGTYYEIEIISDGSAELAIESPGLFRNIWVDEVVINDLEVRPMGIDSVEFDDEGVVEFSFLAIKPGTYEFRIRGRSGEGSVTTFIIE
ncbi:MAG: hypothetical protein ACFB6S_00820 [Geminicoccaceae bacterium]